jgi:hypothetical protein
MQEKSLKRIILIATGLMISALCAAQMPPVFGAGSGSSQGVTASSRTDFGAECGIEDASPSKAMRFIRSAGGNWMQVAVDKRPEPTDSGVARLWRERNWMVDMHDAAMGMSMMKMHTAQMCFSGRGRILRMIDRYMDMPACNCMRYTSLTFDEITGRVVRREQHYISVSGGSEVAAPEAAKQFPEIFPYRRLEQLPFWPVMPKVN